MHIAFTDLSWKGSPSASYATVLITGSFSVDDILASKKTPVLFGWQPDNRAAFDSLVKFGLKPRICCDFAYEHLPPLRLDSSLWLHDYRQLLTEPQNYYFIVYAPEPFVRAEIMKLLMYSGVDEFGVLAEGWTSTFGDRPRLRGAYEQTLNEIFAPAPFIGNFQALDNLLRSSLTGAMYWDIPFTQIYRTQKRRAGFRYLEIGPGIGTMTFTLKKLLSFDATWLVLPVAEYFWSELREPEVRRLVTQHQVRICEGWLETDDLGKLNPPLRPHSFDVIVMAQVMEHLICHPVPTMRKLRELLAPGGKLYISVPEDIRHHNVENYTQMPEAASLTPAELERRRQINEYYHFHEYSFAEASSVFDEAGLELVTHEFTPPNIIFVWKEETDYDISYDNAA